LKSWHAPWIGGGVVGTPTPGKKGSGRGCLFRSMGQVPVKGERKPAERGEGRVTARGGVNVAARTKERYLEGFRQRVKLVGGEEVKKRNELGW